MGNLLKSNHEEDHILELITLSNNTLTTEEIYEIMMKTSCNRQLDLAIELIGLYKRYTELDSEKRGRITNREFLSLSELKYNPFRHRLQKAIPMRSEDYIRNASSSNGKNNAEESFEKATLVPNIVSNKIAPEPDDISEIDQISYIDFLQFCQYLAVFSPRATNEMKFSCITYLVLFRLFDIDEDGILSEEDLQVSIKTLVSGNMPINEINEAIFQIFSENGKEGEKYLSKEEFQKSLWMTDFHQKLSLFFI